MPKGRHRIEEVDLKQAYVAAISSFADLDLIAKAKFKLAVDAMYGSGRGVIGGIFEDHGIRARGDSAGIESVVSRNQSRTHPAARKDAAGNCGERRCHAGLATDGDADRIGAVAEDGSFVDSHKCFASC